jgi:hypothetical protein
VIWYAIDVSEPGGIGAYTDRGIQTDLGAHQHAMSAPIAEVVRELVSILGATTVAVIGNVKETRAVQQWIDGREPQRAHVLRFALQLARMLSSQANREFAGAWFHGSNPYIDDGVPMLLLRTEPLSDIQGPLLRAARAFASPPSER